MRVQHSSSGGWSLEYLMVVRTDQKTVDAVLYCIQHPTRVPGDHRLVTDGCLYEHDDAVFDQQGLASLAGHCAVRYSEDVAEIITDWQFVLLHESGADAAAYRSDETSSA